MAEVWFWQRIVTPHMAGLAVAMARQGHAVTYVAEQPMSEHRARQGWQAPQMPGVTLRIAGSAQAVRQVVEEAHHASVHIGQGLRGNGLVGLAQRELRRRRLRQWVVMETVVDSGLAGLVKRAIYRALFLRWRSHLQGVLATGWCTSGWVQARGMPAQKVFPFAYFLPDVVPDVATVHPLRDSVDAPFRVLFVGQFIALKCLDLLIDVVAACVQAGQQEICLQVVGSGPLEQTLRAHAQQRLGERLQWIGRLPMDEVRARMARADVLVLPSRYDGWGAVVSEALMAGTPAIVSDACGSAGVVQASGSGCMFAAGDARALRQCLERAQAAGSILPPQRQALAAWATSLGAQAGAVYLTAILEHAAGLCGRPLPPWQRQAHEACA